MKNGRSFLAVCVIELGLLGLGLLADRPVWDRGVPGEVPGCGRWTSPRRRYSASRCATPGQRSRRGSWRTRRKPGRRRSIWPHSATPKPWRWAAVPAGRDLVEITTSGGTCSLELYPNAVEMGETLYYSGEPYFSHWLARSGEGSPRPCRKAPWKNWNPDREKRPPPEGRSFGAGGAGRKKLEKCEKHLAILPVRV